MSARLITAYTTREGRAVTVTMSPMGTIWRVFEDDKWGIQREMFTCGDLAELLKRAPPRKREAVTRALIAAYVRARGGAA